MATWTSDELAQIDAADELQVASLRHDGTLSNPVTIWVVRRGDDLYVRSIRGPDSGWFSGTQRSHEGHIQAGGVDKDVTFVETADLDDEIDDAYRTKYGRYPENVLNTTLTPQARSTTLKLVPR